MAVGHPKVRIKKLPKIGDRLFFLSHVGTNPWFFGGSKSHDVMPIISQ
jgi:hypothetical protein